jgi:hypothetical protein
MMASDLGTMTSDLDMMTSDLDNVDNTTPLLEIPASTP